ncbi:hypothetical protein CGRA01v4_09192 [Colletotrichum graminicola]|nr:hypothetical protein CGRA01v4_09192 [Colletotrichum graminicola]
MSPCVFAASSEASELVREASSTMYAEFLSSAAPHVAAIWDGDHAYRARDKWKRRRVSLSLHRRTPVVRVLRV